MKESNKLLANFVREEVEWDDLYEEWVIKGYEPEHGLWEPDTDWNQLHQVLDELKTLSVEDDIILLRINDLLDIPVGNSIRFIYNKVINTVKIINESPINPE